MVLVFALASSLLVAPLSSSATPFGPGSVKGEPKDTRVRSDYFGLGLDIDPRVTGAWPTLDLGAVRISAGWKWIERSEGVYDWAAMDIRVATAEAHGAKPLMEVHGTPLFHVLDQANATSASPPALPAYRSFVRALVARYGTRVDYQVWNEPSVAQFFTGTPAHVAEMTRILFKAVRALAPDAVAVAPSTPLRGDGNGMRRWFRAYLGQKLGPRGRPVTKFFDAASISAYPMHDEDPEDGLALTQYARRILDKYGFKGPLWATEINYGANGPVRPTPPISADLQAAYIVRTFVLHATLGADRVYWFYWTPRTNVNTNLQDGDGGLTPAGTAYDVVKDWVLGAKPTGCQRVKGVSTCGFRVNKRVSRSISWTRSGKVRKMRLPQGAVKRTNPAGVTRRIKPGRSTLKVGVAPVMIEVRRRR